MSAGKSNAQCLNSNIDTAKTINSSKIVSPEQKENIIRRARRLSGIVKANIEEDKGYNFRSRSLSRSGDKNVASSEQTVKFKANKVSKSKSKKEVAAALSQDIRAFSQKAKVASNRSVNADQTSTQVLDKQQILADINSLASNSDTVVPQIIQEVQQQASNEIHLDTPLTTNTMTSTMINVDPKSTVTDQSQANQAIQQLLGQQAEISNKDILKHLTDLMTTHKIALQEALEKSERRITAVEKTQVEVSAKITSITFDTEQVKEDTTKLQTKVELLENKVSLMEGTAIKQEQMIHELKSKLEYVEQQNIKNKLTLYNIDEVAHANENVLLTVINFFRFKMKIKKPVFVQSAFRLGKAW